MRMEIVTLDVCGEVCPIPTIRTKKAMGKLSNGQGLMVILDYPISVDNICRWAEKEMKRIIEVKKSSDCQWQITLCN